MTTIQPIKSPFPLGMTAVFLDPPYSHDLRDSELYAHEDDCGSAVREWALANGDNPLLRIALCGYEGEHDMPDSWECVAWKANGGYGSQNGNGDNANAHKERIWFSPHCLKPESSYQALTFDL
jgi:DNA adenine methylase